MKRLLLPISLAVLIAAPSASAAGPFASSVDSGDLPHAYAGGSLEAPKRPPRLQIRSSPDATLEISVDVQCLRGGHSVSKETDLIPQAAPVDRRIRLTMKNPENCYLSASVWFEDVEQAGWIAAKLFR